MANTKHKITLSDISTAFAGEKARWQFPAIGSAIGLIACLLYLVYQISTNTDPQGLQWENLLSICAVLIGGSAFACLVADVYVLQVKQHERLHNALLVAINLSSIFIAIWVATKWVSQSNQNRDYIPAVNTDSPTSFLSCFTGILMVFGAYVGSFCVLGKLTTPIFKRIGAVEEQKQTDTAVDDNTM